MKREVYWYHGAVEDVSQLAARDERQANRVLVAVRQFGGTGRGDVKKLRGAGDWRLRVGNWRVVYRLLDDALYVSSVTDRQDAY
ncbi:MAG: type II toxin-antitoxin system RelE/ParE family toxin [Dehalococcoidia bacterium]|nr:type II toxin-antitoxin system RelE/ParE family toxin [Dehalococcoidia bacterium]